MPAAPTREVCAPSAALERRRAGARRADRHQQVLAEAAAKIASGERVEVLAGQRPAVGLRQVGDEDDGSEGDQREPRRAVLTRRRRCQGARYVASRRRRRASRARQRARGAARGRRAAETGNPGVQSSVLRSTTFQSSRSSHAQETESVTAPIAAKGQACQPVARSPSCANPRRLAGRGDRGDAEQRPEVGRPLARRRTRRHHAGGEVSAGKSSSSRRSLARRRRRKARIASPINATEARRRGVP